jgi:hypothetical protein
LSGTAAADANTFAWVRPLALKTIIGSLIAAALIGVLAVVTGDFGDVSWRAMGTITLLLYFAFASWYDADISARRAVWFGALSGAASIYLLIVGLAKVWLPSEDNSWFPPFLVWIGLAIVTRVALIHVHLLLNIYRRFESPVMKAISYVTFFLVALLAVGLSLPMLFPDADFSAEYWRLFAAIAILDALGTGLIPLVHAFFGPKGTAPEMESGTRGEPAPAPSEQSLPALPVPTTPPAGSSYAPLIPTPGSLLLAWPRYADGRPLPAREDGTPDFSGVVGY